MMELKKQQYKREKERPVIDMNFGKVPPQSKDLEEAVLGAIMLEKSAFDQVSDLLKPESFYVEAHQRVFKAMVTLAAKNMPIDQMTIAEQLIKTAEIELVGGIYFISKLTNSVVSSANIDSHARIISEKATSRELIKLGGEICTDAFDDTVDVFEQLDGIDARLTQIISGNQKKNYVPIGTSVIKSIQRIEELKHQDSSITGIPSGFTGIDNITHGWQNTDLIILAARPSVGKTAFAGNLVRNAAGSFQNDYLRSVQSGNIITRKSVVLFSLEMSTGQLTNRLISAESGILLDQISNGRVSDQQMQKLYKETAGALTELPVFIDDTAALNIFELRAKCRRLKNKENLGLIVIDYLQLMSGGGGGNTKTGNREQEISSISRDLKGLAKELEIPIIALSQLSRQVEMRKGETKIPQLSDLRESGAIEQDADMVMFLYRPDYYGTTTNENGESNKGETYLKIAKHRNGTLDTVQLRAALHIQKFYDADDTGFNIPAVPAGLAASGGNWKSVRNTYEPQDKSDDLPF